MPDVSATWGEPASELPEISKRELLKRYRMRVDSVVAFRDSEGYDDTWERLRDLYRLRTFSDADSEEDRLLVAIAFATINVIEPSIAINHPKITVSATSIELADQATIAEAVLNYYWAHFNIQPQFRLGAKDMLVYGHGWLKVGWRYTTADVPLSTEELQQQATALTGQADQFAMDNPAMAGDLPSDQEIVNQLPTTRTQVVEDRPFVERVSPFDVYVDPEAIDLEDAQWLAQRVVRPLEEVKADKRYKSGSRRKVEADGSAVWHLEQRGRSDVPAERDRVTLWEFYDLRRKTVSVFAESSGEFLLDPEPMPYLYGLPFVMIRDYDVPDQFYPIGELEALEPLQMELNETRTSMVLARKATKRKWMMRKTSMTSEAVSALTSDQDMAVIPVEDDEDFDRILAPLPHDPVDAQLFQHSDVVLSDFDRISGISEYQRGELPEVRRTATEASIIQDASNARAADKLARVEHAAAEVARRLLMLAQQYLDGDQALRVTGNQGKVGWFQWKPEDIQGEFDFSVEAGSMQPMNETFRRQQATQLAAAMEPFVMGGVVNPFVLASHLLREGFGIKNPERFIIAPAPVAVGPDGQSLPPDAAGGPPPSGPPGPPGAQAPPQGGDQKNSILDQTIPQLRGQVGLNVNTLGGGALGPGGG